MSQEALNTFLAGVAALTGVIGIWLAVLYNRQGTKDRKEDRRLAVEQLQLAREQTAQRPKLEFYVNDSHNANVYQTKDVNGQVYRHVYATLANVGKVAAHNIRGRVEFEPRGHAKAFKRADIDTHITNVFDNNVYLHWENLVPRPYPPIGTPREWEFLDSPKHFVLPVRAMGETNTEIHFWFSCDEGEVIEGVRDLGPLGDPITLPE